MPRTKRVRTSENNVQENIKPNKTKLVRNMINFYLKAVEDEGAMRKLVIEDHLNHLNLDINSALQEQCLKFHLHVNKTMAELKVNKSAELNTISEMMSLRNISTSTRKSGYKGKNYSTKENDSVLKTSSRSIIKKAKHTRASRSISRNKMQQVKMGINTYATPIGQNISSASFGLVTPKVKPNTPQVVLRRPKQGEIAISMQGSPLMVSSTANEQEANVNIPLLDGRIISIQPHRGLRVSQIPSLDPETKRQIETLRDNLNKVCALNTHH